ncbi:uncharacterized protein KY384_003182 [Bacidia gigantensis]|uniref:uncharacterized protein n=1 Tax=Bacidia gigantensis TaxID=2732470 RepID=UPI001D046D57|nr:uncharacterized protein KY384_003182 [Bacidia gigantensis]KAG8531552.1 hypothetical protein KY384_003182 [Bacidia gigantensis]
MPLIMQQDRIKQSRSSSDYDRSETLSESSFSTIPTCHSSRPSVRSRSGQGFPPGGNQDSSPRHIRYDYSPVRFSSDSIASSASSSDEFNDHLPHFEVPDGRAEATSPSVVAATPHEFAAYFPSTERMSIKHDDSDDGNMNLRLETKASTRTGDEVDLTLFHLRMYDLRDREFSLRRYCRDSGKEVCHSTRKYVKPSVITRPGLQRSMSSALSSLRPKSDSKSIKVETLRRQDSGYDSMSEDDDDDEEMTSPSQQPKSDCFTRPSNTIKIEFSNYAHLEVRRTGAKSNKRYEFEYWGTKYAWRRAAMRRGNFSGISYHLDDVNRSKSIAHIVPVPLSTSEARDEAAKGGDDDVVERPSDVAEYG